MRRMAARMALSLIGRLALLALGDRERPRPATLAWRPDGENYSNHSRAMIAKLLQSGLSLIHI